LRWSRRCCYRRCCVPAPVWQRLASGVCSQLRSWAGILLRVRGMGGGVFENLDVPWGVFSKTRTSKMGNNEGAKLEWLHYKGVCFPALLKGVVPCKFNNSTPPLKNQLNTSWWGHIQHLLHALHVLFMRKQFTREWGPNCQDLEKVTRLNLYNLARL